MTTQGYYDPTTGATVLGNTALSGFTTAGTIGNGLMRTATKTITFTGAAGAGAVGSVAVFTVSGGAVEVRYIVGRVTTSLTGATATVSLGTSSQTGVWIGATTATAMTTSAELWVSTTPTAGAIALGFSSGVVTDQNIIITVAVANVTGGVLELDAVWQPLTPGATLS